MYMTMCSFIGVANQDLLIIVATKENIFFSTAVVTYLSYDDVQDQDLIKIIFKDQIKMKIQDDAQTLVQSNEYHDQENHK